MNILWKLIADYKYIYIWCLIAKLQYVKYVAFLLGTPGIYIYKYNIYIYTYIYAGCPKKTQHV